ncbi:hypothetical protein DFH07DRAFT_867964 [Mycena maculata]|uniref:CxC2-like cysteine cluster KDZ transposase-associated domain-containing protein n=1 Tax=Mycena maculata TaxID=230809 RepID=A0AAD7J917_9AGAR|nr:hypothetical protein DFH07DRAFT_867964 [Mycena maculata]
MPRDRRRCREGAGGAGVAQSTSIHSHVISFGTGADNAEDEAIPAYVDRASADNRRVYREEIPVAPPSPIKKLRAERDAANYAPPEEESFASSEPFHFEYYEMQDAEGYGPPKDQDSTKTFISSDESLAKWLDRRDDYLNQWTWREGRCDANIEVCPGCQCKDDAPRFRCRECHGHAMYCKPCIVARHHDNPLHKIMEWNGDWFIESSLASVGLRIQLGHAPFSRCTAPEAANKGFVVMHTNGIHEVTVDFCGCEHAAYAGPPKIQILRAGWFPATNERPQTCATMEMLNDFHFCTLQAKMTMYDYYAVLEKKTNNIGIKAVDRYHEFVRMCKKYRHLKMLKRGGRAPDYDATGTAGTKMGALAIQCPSCPRPGVNLQEDWEDAAEDEWHLYTFFLALDACFRLKRRLISSELKDPGLGVGLAYMVENEPYREYLRTVTDQKEMNTCTGLAALDYAHTKFSRGYATTGVGMGVCARHEFIQPNGVGDLQRGERFANMDYIFGSIMRHKHAQLRKLISYDIVCSWKKILRERMATMPKLVQLNMILTLFKFVIPKMHIHAHNLVCRLLYSLNLIPGSAQVDGEGIERPWASIGAVTTSTVQMGPGARHGVLDCQWSHWNWQKLVGLVALLRRRMDRSRVELPVQQAAFDTFSDEHAANVPRWKKAVLDFEKTGVDNPYEVKVQGLTEAEVRLQFAEEEAADAARGVTPLHDVSPSKFLTIGLEIEEEQRRVKVQVLLKKANTTAMKIDLGALRTRLTHRVNQFRKLQSTYMPISLQALGAMAIAEDEVIERMPLMLPSALTKAQREGAGCMAGLGNMEEMMRDAQCRTALARLRNQLNVKSRLLIYTKHQTMVARNESKIRLHSEKYQVAWESIRRLSPSGDAEKVGWQLLRKEDIRCMEDDEDVEKKVARSLARAERMQKKRAELIAHGLLPSERDDDWEDMDGDESIRVPENRRQVSWIWTVAGEGGADIALEDALRIEWSKAYARVRRWTEEKSLLEKEYVRFGLSMDYETEKWENRAQEVRVGVVDRAQAEGAVAYAKRQAEMYRDLKRRGEMVWTAEKTKRGKKKPRYAPESLVEEEEEADGQDDEDEGEREGSSDGEDQDEEGGDSDDEEYIMDGVLDGTTENARPPSNTKVARYPPRASGITRA